MVTAFAAAAAAAVVEFEEEEAGAVEVVGAVAGLFVKMLDPVVSIPNSRSIDSASPPRWLLRVFLTSYLLLTSARGLFCCC